MWSERLQQTGANTTGGKMPPKPKKMRRGLGPATVLVLICAALAPAPSVGQEVPEAPAGDGEYQSSACPLCNLLSTEGPILQVVHA